MLRMLTFVLGFAVTCMLMYWLLFRIVIHFLKSAIFACLDKGHVGNLFK